MYKRRSKRNCCVNCGEIGHVFKTCTKPITSYGIIAMSKKTASSQIEISSDRYICKYHQQQQQNNNSSLSVPLSSPELCFLMVRRRDTMGYIDFVRGKYDDDKQMRTYISEMTCDERNKLVTKTFDEIWDQMWVNHSCKMFTAEKSEAAAKFANLDLSKILEEIPCNYYEPEWCIPKGRKNISEGEEHCALREFKEETGYGGIRPFIDRKTWTEQFVGTNGVTYRHIYYCTYIPEWRKRPEYSIESVRKAGEISDVRWMTLSECLKYIRPYDVAKKQLLKDVAYYYSHCKKNEY